MKQPIPLMKPYLTALEEKAVSEVLQSGWLTQGKKTFEFEEVVRKYVGARYAVATTSCTTALHLSLLSLDISPGDEVIVPSFSFIASANAILHCGARPIFIDIDLATYNLDPEKIESLITKKTKAILVVHQVGLPADMDRIEAIAEKYNIAVVEDAACALGAKYKGKKIGSDSKIACFSFHPRKIITTGQGGMIVTRDKKLSIRIRQMRQHGMSISDFSRHKMRKFIPEQYRMLGYNYLMTDIQAAIGIEQMLKIDMILKRRKLFAQRYNKALQHISWLQIPFVPDYAVHTYQSYVIRVNDNFDFSRDTIIQKLLKKGIQTKRGPMAIHQQEYYRNKFRKIYLPNTERAAKQTITLPLFHQMTKRNQDYIIDELMDL